MSMQLVISATVTYPELDYETSLKFRAQGKEILRMADSLLYRVLPMEIKA